MLFKINAELRTSHSTELASLAIEMVLSFYLSDKVVTLLD